MRDYWLTKDLLQAVGIGVGLLALLSLALALALPKRWWGKLAAAATVCVFFSFPVLEARKEMQQKQEEAQAYQQRLNEAQALFQERCKTAGEKIYRTVDNVEGIFLMKLRPESINYKDQFKLDDPYGRSFSGKTGYIESFLRRETQIIQSDAPRSFAIERIGYQYVEAVDPQDGKRYRYTGSMKAVGRMDESAPNIQAALKRNSNFDLNIYRFVLDKVPATDPGPRYGVTYDDISTHEEREYWIAGSSLKVIDLQTQEVIAERVGYMVDARQGSGALGRSHWLLAADNACPAFAPPGSNAQPYQTPYFVEKTLKPKLKN